MTAELPTVDDPVDPVDPDEHGDQDDTPPPGRPRLGRVAAHPGVRLGAVVLAALALLGMVVAYYRATSTLADVAATCRERNPAACQAAAAAGEARIVQSGPKVLGTDPTGEPLTSDLAEPGGQPRSGPGYLPGEVTTLPALPGAPRTVLQRPAPPETIERTVVRESTIAGTPTRVTETVTEAAPPPGTVTVERTRTVTVTPGSSPDGGAPSSTTEPPGDQGSEPTPTALGPTGGWWPPAWFAPAWP